METSLRLSQHVELHCTMATVTRSDAEWNVELGALRLMLALWRALNALQQITGTWSAAQTPSRRKVRGSAWDHVSPGRLISQREL